MNIPLLALMLVQQSPEAHVISVERVNLGQPLSGFDFLLIAEAVRRPEMGGADLSCYRIYVYNEGGERRVAFVEARDRVVERKTDAGTEITYLPPDPKCRSITFVMDDDGGVARVIHSRH